MIGGHAFSQSWVATGQSARCLAPPTARPGAVSRQVVGLGGPRPPGTPPHDARFSPGVERAHGHGPAAETRIRRSDGAVFPPGAWLDGHVSRSCPGPAGVDGPAVPGSFRGGSAGVLHSLSLLKLLILLIWRSHLAYATCGAPSSPWLKPSECLSAHIALCPPCLRTKRHPASTWHAGPWQVSNSAGVTARPSHPARSTS